MSGAAARLARLERAAKRKAEPEDVELHFIFGGGPEEAAAIAAGEKILRFDYSGNEAVK